MLLQLFERNRKARGELGGVENRRALLTACREEMSEERLQDTESLRRDRADRTFWKWMPRVRALSVRRLGNVAGMRLYEPGETMRHRVPKLLGLEGSRAAVLSQHPPCEQLDL